MRPTCCSIPHFHSEQEMSSLGQFPILLSSRASCVLLPLHPGKFHLRPSHPCFAHQEKNFKMPHFKMLFIGRPCLWFYGFSLIIVHLAFFCSLIHLLSMCLFGILSVCLHIVLYLLLPVWDRGTCTMKAKRDYSSLQL